MKTRALLLVLPLLAVGPAGCVVDNRASITVQAVCAPTTDCTFTEKCDAQYIGFATIDTSAAEPRLWLFLQVANQLPDNSDPDLRRTNTNGAHVDTVSVEYDGIGLPKQVVGVQYFVPAAGTAVISADVIPAGTGGTTLAGYATATGQEMTAKIRVGGYLDDATRFETGEFTVAVRVCNGCVTSCGAGTPVCPPGGDGQLPKACAL